MTNLKPPATAARSANGSSRPHHWPDGTATHRVVFVTDRPTDHRLIGELPPALNRRAVALPPAAKQLPDMELLSVPAGDPAGEELTARARAWVAEAGEAGVQTITFQGAVLVWGFGRAAVVAPVDRLPALEAVLAEVAHYEAELRAAETRLGDLWPELEADAGPAFEFDHRSARHRPRMAQRFAQLLGIRARVSRILPAVLTPHVYPPTLASQVSERLRERLRLRHRVEMLQEQLEVFERIYDTLGQRASDFRANRKGHVLEMIIIVLLAAQIVLYLFQLFAMNRVVE